jgi:two-component system sensor histidine kinase ChvG
MASDIATATDRSLDEADRPARRRAAAPSLIAGEPATSATRAGEPAALPAPRRWRERRGWFSPLTVRILAVNVLALALLGLGLLYVGKYEASLIDTELQALQTQGEIFAAALGEGAVLESAGEGERLIPELGRQMMRRLVEPTRTRARLFDVDGGMVADSRLLRGNGGVVQIRELPPLNDSGPLAAIADTLYDWIASRVPRRSALPVYQEPAAPTAADFPEVQRALGGEKARNVRTDRSTGGLLLSVAVPVQRYKQVLGAVMLSVGSNDIEQAVRAVRLDILKVFLIAFAVTVCLSIYLASTIARPIRILAAGAERVRRGSGRKMAIPDLRRRHDEIGDLSRALREMTGALWQRMDAIEHFAADVAHEIKNPLTSVRSAVETISRTQDPQKQKKLLQIVLEDVQRLDRLISDISDASRLDSELSRSEPEPVAVGRMLATLVELHEATTEEAAPRLVLALPPGADPGDARLTVLGIEGRLVQVFRNLIANAISFSPPGGTIRIGVARHDGAVLVSIEDDGPGIPEGKLEAIFNRFYSERPSGEKFGTHSGLGLSISKQIVEAHRGAIRAENRRDVDGSVMGARFVVRLPTG